MNNKDIRTIMVTGVGGFLGGELLNKLYNNTNYNIVGITSKKEDIYRNYKNQNILVCYNIEGWEKEKIPWNSIDLIVHCAFSRSYDGFSLAKAIKFTKDLFMTAKINCVKGIINISSQSVYGNVFMEISQNRYGTKILRYHRIQPMQWQNMQQKY